MAKDGFCLVALLPTSSKDRIRLEWRMKRTKWELRVERFLFCSSMIRTNQHELGSFEDVPHGCWRSTENMEERSRFFAWGKLCVIDPQELAEQNHTPGCLWWLLALLCPLESKSCAINNAPKQKEHTHTCTHFCQDFALPPPPLRPHTRRHTSTHEHADRRTLNSI